jgi:hypothetical protein
MVLTYIQRAPWLVLPQVIPAYQPDKVLATIVDQGIFLKKYLKIIFKVFFSFLVTKFC